VDPLIQYGVSYDYPTIIGVDKARPETDKLAGKTARLFVRGRSQWEITFLKPTAKGVSP